MIQRTSQLIQLFFVLFAVYSVFHYTGSQQKLIPFFCLMAAYGLEKLPKNKKENTDKKTITKKSKKIAEKDAITHHLNCLIKSRNPLIIADAVQYIFHDLGLLVSKTQGSQIISRLVRNNREDTPVGLIVLLDISQLSEWSEWDKITKFAAKQGPGYQTLIIWSNCYKTEAGKMNSKKFPVGTKEILSRKNVVALSTYTLYLIYYSCKKGTLDIHKVLEQISNHPGGIITLKR